jgi:hypothetical protein
MLNALITKFDQDLQPAIGLALAVEQGSTPNNNSGPSDLPMDDVESAGEKRLKPLFAYLDAQLAILHFNLYPGLFRTVLQQLFVSVLNSIERLLLPCISKMHVMAGHSAQHAKSHQGIKKHLKKHERTHAVQVGSRAAVRGIVMQQAQIAHFLIDDIVSFFEADGEGLKSRFMDRHTLPLKRSLALFHLDDGGSFLPRGPFFF